MLRFVMGAARAGSPYASFATLRRTLVVGARRLATLAVLWPIVTATPAAAQARDPMPTTVTGLQQMLAEDPSSGRRVSAARVLGTLGDSARVALPALMAALNDPHSYVRSAAATSLSRLAPEDAQVVGAIAAALGDADLGVRSTAAVALGALGPAGRSVVPDLIRALETDAYYGVREAAAASLGRIAPGDTTLVPLLERALTGASRDSAFDAMPANRRYYSHVAGAAADALTSMGDAGVTTLLAAMAAGHPTTTVAAEALARTIPQLHPRIPDVIDVLRMEDAGARESASWLLTQIGDPAVPYLAAVLERAGDPLRNRVVSTLRRIDTPLAREALAANQS